tara:strand:- start:37192 stop:38535 length:1344 start_codon:yes stop_codon:yes gene_type:complete
MKYLSLIVLLAISAVTIAQENISFGGMLEAAGYASSQNELPLWMYANQSRELGARSNVNGTAEIFTTYKLTDSSSVQFKGSTFYRNDVSDELQRKELFIEFKNTWLRVTAGAKENPEVAQGLSSTNQNFLWSRNHRPLPGLKLATSKPLRINNTFSIDASIAHYQLNDDRFVKDTRLHYKHLALITQLNDRTSITSKIQHVAQWAGTSPQFGELPNDIEAFIDVFFAKEAQESGEVNEGLNAVGNHIGTYLLEYNWKAKFGAISWYHEHPFEDGSGTRLANFPDGVWGVYWQPNNSNFISGVLYEFTTTKDQSGSFGVGQDNYFGNRIYRSGYSYEGEIIGFPFILNDPTLELDESTIAIISNRVAVHHFGLAGQYKSVLWLLKSSIAKSFGRFINPFPEPVTTTHHFLESTYPTESFGSFTLILGLDTSSVIETNFGAALQYRYQF